MTKVDRTTQGFEVSLPQVYHSGHVVNVVVQADHNGFTVHDNGYASMLLSSIGIALNTRLIATFKAQIESYGCELNGMRVTNSCNSIDQIAITMTLVGCASRLIADHPLKVERQPIYDFKSHLLGKVLDAVGDKRVRTNEEVRGHLGSRYRISTVVLDKAQAKPIAFVEPIADRDAVPRRFKEFYDIKLNPDYSVVDRIVVYDEQNPMSSGDALLLQEVSNLVRFADAPNRFVAWSTVQ
jgi:hypothetical protein